MSWVAAQPVGERRASGEADGGGLLSKQQQELQD
uniref:Uncharacterized protein n=1 Tax=Anguilla anguilla TaxID=7936 RepID=A0A0E9SZF5_ANGAN